jgi:phosphoribosylformylglycinamidine synthase
LVKPKVNLDKTFDIPCLKKNYDVVHQAIINKSIISAYSLKHFGLAEGLSKMSIGNDIGVEFLNVNEKELFELAYGTLIVEIPQNHDISQVLKGSNYKIIGKTIKQPLIVNKKLGFKININDIKEKITSKLSDIFVHTTPKDNTDITLQTYHCSRQ